MDSNSIVHYITDNSNLFSFACKLKAPDLKAGVTFTITNDITKVTCPKCKLKLAKE